MKTQLIQCLAIVVLNGIQLTAEAQHKSPELIRIEDKLVRSVASEMPDWKHKSGTSIEGSEDVATERWTLENKAIFAITIVGYSSPQEAQEHIKQFTRDMKGVKSNSESADEQYSLPTPGETVSRKHRFLYYMTVRSAEPAETDKLFKRVAQFVADAIKDK
jgi:hypothetical protein